MATRGIIAAFSKNASQDIISDDALMSWYDEIHIPDVIATSGMRTALRFEAINPEAKYRWLVVYPVNDIGFAATEEFDKIPKGGHKEIGGREFTDLAELDLRIGARTQVIESNASKKGRASYLVAESIKVPEGNEAPFEKWYDEEYLEQLKKISSFRRVTRYKVVQSLVPNWPEHLAFYEFDTADIPFSEIEKIRQTARGQEALKGVTVDEVGYKLVKEAGILAESL